jgi:hypothetical protein
MNITVEELANRLNAEADRRGLSPARLLEQLSAQLPMLDDGIQEVGPATRHHIAFAAVGSSSGEVRARDLDDALAEGFGRP